MAEDLMLVLGTWAAVGVALFAVIMNTIAQRENTEAQKNHYKHVKNTDKANLQMRGLGLAFEKINGADKRLARKRVVTTYYQCLKKKGYPTTYTPDTFKDHLIYDITEFDRSVSPYVESVKADFEEIAVMIHNDLLDKKAYFDAHCLGMIRCYMALHGNINAAREKSGSEHYTTYLQKYSEEDGLQYWRDNHPNSKINFYADGPEQTRLDDFKTS